jgi:hypothetical protein
MKANEMHCFSDLFDKVLYMFWTCPLSIIRSISINILRKIVHQVGFIYKMGMGSVVPNVELGQTGSSFEM